MRGCLSSSMRTAIFFILSLCAISMAFMADAKVIEVKDTGSESLPALDVGIRIDCDTTDLTVSARTNGTGQPVPGAQMYLFYTDYGYQVIASGKGGDDGVGKIDVIGNMDFLTGLFILRVDASMHRSREIEFTYWDCGQEPPEEVIPPEAEPPEVQPEEPASEPGIQPDEVEPVYDEPVLVTQPETPSGPVGPAEDSGPVTYTQPSACPLGIILALGPVALIAISRR